MPLHRYLDGITWSYYTRQAYYNLMKMSARYSLWHLEAAVAPNQFSPKPWVPSLIGHLLQISHICLLCQPLKGKMIRVVME